MLVGRPLLALVTLLALLGGARSVKAEEAPLVVICADQSADAARLADELRLLGFRVRTEDGRSPGCTGDGAMADGVTATVAVPKDGGYAILTTGSSSSELTRAAGEAPNAFALRTAEHVRGRLLPTAVVHAPPPEPYRFAVHVAPALAIATYGGPALSVVGDVTYFWGDFGVGPFAIAALTTTPWAEERAQFSQRQLTFGGQARMIALRAENPGLELHALLNAGARLQTLEALKGPEAGQFVETAYALTFGGAFEVLYSPNDWFAFGGQTGLQLGIPLAWPAPIDTLDNPAQKALEDAQTPSVDCALLISAVASFRL